MRPFHTVIGTLVAVALQASGRATYQLHSRDATDTCAWLSGDLSILGKDLGLLDQCLCVSGITGFVLGHPGWGLLDLEIELALSDWITLDGKFCKYPDNSGALCSKADPCGFQCKDGYESPDCKCKLPNTECNGKCGIFKHCPSSGPKKREAELRQRRAACEPGLTVCGVYGMKSANAWECVDTRTDLESCGGCVVGIGRTPALGVDCTSLPGVMDVACISGSCAVQRCLPGYDISPGGTRCINSSVRPQFAQNDFSAAVYGLEHAPLKKKST